MPLQKHILSAVLLYFCYLSLTVCDFNVVCVWTQKSYINYSVETLYSHLSAYMVLVQVTKDPRNIIPE